MMRMITVALVSVHLQCHRLVACAMLIAMLTCPALVRAAGTVLVNETFEDNVLNGFNDAPPSQSGARIVTGDSYGTGTKAYQITYSRDEEGYNLNRYPVQFDSIEVSYAQKFPDGIPINTSARGWCGLKQSRLFNGTAGNVQHEIHYFRPGWDAPGSPARWNHQLYVEQGNHVFNTQLAILPNTWHHIRYWAKLNSAGQRDGALKFWFNGQLKVDQQGLSFSPTITGRVTGVMVGGNFSNGGSNPDVPFRRLLDDIVVTINGDAPATNQLTIAPIARQTTREDTISAAIPIRVSRGTAPVRAVRVTATSSNPALVPNAGLTITGSSANWSLKAQPAANRHGTTSIRVQADDGAGLTAQTFELLVAPVADTPAITPAATTLNRITMCGLVAGRNTVDGVEVTHFKVTNIVNGMLYLHDGLTAVTNGRFLTFAQANAGLRFRPATGFVGTATFDVRASISASDAGLGGSAVQGQILVTR